MFNSDSLGVDISRDILLDVAWNFASIAAGTSWCLHTNARLVIIITQRSEAAPNVNKR